MDELIKCHDLIALREAVQEGSLSAGRVGRVLQVGTAGEFEAEFSDSYAHPVAKVWLKANQFIVLRDEVTLDEATFWKLIEDTRVDSGGDSERQLDLLVERLVERSVADIIAFGDWVDHFRDAAYRTYLWSAATIICGGCSDDGFMDFRDWLIAQGKQIYFDALRDPEILADVVPLATDELDTYGDAMLGLEVEWDAYEKKIGNEFPIFIGGHMPTISADDTHIPPMLTVERWDYATAYEKYPKLTAKFDPGKTWLDERS